MKKVEKWYKKVSNWLIIVAAVLLTCMLIVNVNIMIQSKKNKDVVPSIFGYKPFIVLSGSMETEIHVGDLIITKVIDPEDLVKDDVIAFRDAEGTVTTHRIIDIVTIEDNKYFVTKGDNNNTQDKNMVELSDVEGIYVTSIPGIGKMMDSLAKPTTIVIVILGITVIFVVGFLISTKKEKNQELEEFLAFKKQKEEEEAKKKETKKVSKKSGK